MKWNFENGRLSFSADNTNLFSMKGLSGKVELDGTFVAADDCAAHGIRWVWDVRETESGLVVRATLKNESASMVRIGVFDVLYGKTNSLNWAITRRMCDFSAGGPGVFLWKILQLIKLSAVPRSAC